MDVHVVLGRTEYEDNAWVIGVCLTKERAEQAVTEFVPAQRGQYAEVQPPMKLGAPPRG